MKIYIKTYGCTANRSESELMAGLLLQAGHEIVPEEQADIILLNTCIVKSTTEQKILNKISKIKKPLVVAGCMPEAYPEKILSANPNAVLLSTGQIIHVVEAIEKRKSFLGKSKIEKVCLPRCRTDSRIAIVQIAEGCLGNCTYCATKLAKGDLFSFRPSKIIKEIDAAIRGGEGSPNSRGFRGGEGAPKALCANNFRYGRGFRGGEGAPKCKEVWLTAQDTAAYGKDIGFSLPQLLDLLPQGQYKVRIGMMNPASVLPILDELIQAYKDEKIIKFLHLPVQSGDDSILRKMNRSYTVQDFEKIVNAFRSAFPRLVLWTDVIVGYPGETREQFNNTLELLKRIKPAKVNISRYSKRDRTPAANLKQLNTKELKRRSRLISSLFK